jgi:ribosomal protein S20
MSKSLNDIKEDPFIRKALHLRKTSEAAINLERIEEELRVLHASRTSRKLYKMALEPTRIAEAAMRDMSNRARISELKTSVHVQQKALETAYEAATDHLGTVYGQAIKEAATNATDRKFVMHKILRPLRGRLAELESTMTAIEISLKDIDQAAWSIKVASEMLKMTVERHGSVL